MEPRDTSRYRKYSLVDSLARSSAIIEGMDTAARCICELSPYIYFFARQSGREFIDKLGKFHCTLPHRQIPIARDHYAVPSPLFPRARAALALGGSKATIL